MALAAYNGHEPLTFTDYIDLATGKTLHAEPRPEPYDVAPASGRLVPDVPQAWFTPVPQPPPAKTATVKIAPKPAWEPAHDEDPETDDPQQS